MNWLKLLSVFYRTSIQTDMEYRADFFTRIIASLLGLMTTVGSLSIAFRYTGEIKGWSFSDALVLLSVYYLMDGLVETFIGPNMREIMNQVREGTLDFVLLKPVNSQFMATFRTVNIWRAANALVGLGLATYSVTRLSLEVGWQEATLFALTMACGMAVLYSLWLALVTLTFWFVRIDNLEQIIWQAFETGRYPVEIYPDWLRVTLTYIVPVVFILTIPATALAGRLELWQAGAAVGIAFAAILLSAWFWRFGLRHYTGASA